MLQSIGRLMVCTLCALSITQAASQIRPGHERRAMSREPAQLTGSQIQLIMELVSQAGAPSGSNLMSLQTSNGLGFTISAHGILIANPANEYRDKRWNKSCNLDSSFRYRRRSDSGSTECSGSQFSVHDGRYAIDGAIPR